mmetsp:Transcript_19285/g.50120  ORF Transcript_19285/g.50120 Transcript_19285/m.50120 type:complete len:149 (-) Transcript_19285:255-701(-)
MAAPLDVVFKLFAKDSKKVGKADVPDIVRSQGLCPTDKQLADAMAANGVEGDADIGAVKGVLKALENTRSTDLAGELKNAFSTFDSTGDGSVSITELTHILTTSGEKLSVDVVNEVIHMASASAVDSFGGLIYNQFATEAASSVDMSC